MTSIKKTSPDDVEFQLRKESVKSELHATRTYAQHFTKSFGLPGEWHATKLPHRNKPGLIQFITFRLADSLPQVVLRQIENEIQVEKDIEKQERQQYWLDKGLGCCALANIEMAKVMQNALLHHDGNLYNLLAWSIMPNHVHALIKIKGDLVRIVQSWKSFTGRWALANIEKFNLGIDKDAKQFWMPDYWDKFIRDAEHFDHTVRYILRNPEAAGLPKGHIAYLYRGVKLE